MVVFYYKHVTFAMLNGLCRAYLYLARAIRLVFDHQAIICGGCCD